MKTHHALIIGLFVIASGVFPAHGQDATLATAQFQVESSRTKSIVSPAVTPADTLAPLEGARDTRSVLRSIVGSEEASIGDRIDAVHVLGSNLSRDAIATLTIFLKSPLTGESCALKGLRVLKNDLLNVFEGQLAPPPGHTDLLIQMFQDPAQDEVIRDYAIQHIGGWYELAVAAKPAEQEKIRNVLYQATRENTTIAGTALLSLHRLFARAKNSDGREIDAIALNLARATDTQTATRITALQVCAERGLNEVVPTADSLARNSTDMLLRRSAIAALGQLGGAEHVTLLQQLETEQNKPLHATIHAALLRLHQKQQFHLAVKNP